jgi:hypothetical protein
MAFNSEPDSNVAESKFNEAGLKMKRIDSLQNTINHLRCGLFDRYTLDGKPRFGFEIIFSCLESLFQEVSSKLSVKETAENKILYNHCYNSLTKLMDKQERIKFLHVERKELKDSFSEYETFIRKMLEVHHFGSPNKSESSLF